MNIEEYKYLWETGKADWVLINTEYGYGIVNKKTQIALVVSSEELEAALIAKMLESGNRIYEDINEAYDDV